VDRVQVDILGLSTNPASGGAFALILKEVNGPRRLPIIIGASEAQSIALEMEGIKPPRPLTHDLIKNIITSFGSELQEIIIDELKDGTFYAKLTIDERAIDSRPSDAIALAVRYGVHIYVASNVMDEAAFIPEEEEEEGETGIEPAKKDEEKPAPKAKSKLEQLQLALREAVEKENYEKAAQLRDEIQKLSTHEN